MTKLTDTIKSNIIKRHLNEDATADGIKAVELNKLASTFVTGMTKLKRAKANGHIIDVMHNNKFVVYGHEIGWTGEYGDIYIILDYVNDADNGMFSAYILPKHDLRTITLYVVPKGKRLTTRTLRNAIAAVTSEGWKSVVFHELVHVMQWDSGRPGTTIDHKSEQSYYNDASEFDAFYMQLSTKYARLLNMLQNDKFKEAQQIWTDVKFSRDFTTALTSGLPISKHDGILKFARKKQYKRIVKKLYELHSAIFHEIDRIKEENPAKWFKRSVFKEADESDDGTALIHGIASKLATTAAGASVVAATPLAKKAAKKAVVAAKNAATAAKQTDTAKTIYNVVNPAAKKVFKPLARQSINSAPSVVARVVANSAGAVSKEGMSLSTAAARELVAKYGVTMLKGLGLASSTISGAGWVYLGVSGINYLRNHVSNAGNPVPGEYVDPGVNKDNFMPKTLISPPGEAPYKVDPKN